MKDDRILLRHILDSIGYIEDDTREGANAFYANRTKKDAVLKNLEVIGEAVKSVSPQLREKYPDIPWRQIGAMRDKLIHEYWGVNLKLVWDVVEKDLPELKATIQQMLAELNRPSGPS
jgi:uncharacterized protein with HEPN domain